MMIDEEDLVDEFKQACVVGGGELQQRDVANVCKTEHGKLLHERGTLTIEAGDKEKTPLGRIREASGVFYNEEANRITVTGSNAEISIHNEKDDDDRY